MNKTNRINGFFKGGMRTADVRPEGFPFGGAVPVKPDPEHQVLVLKINKLEEKLDMALDLIKELTASRYPKFVGTKEACQILGIGRSTMMARISKGIYPFAFKDRESGEWRFNLAELNLYITR